MSTKRGCKPGTWGLRHRNVRPGGEQTRKREELAVKGQQYKAGWEGSQE